MEVVGVGSTPRLHYHLYFRIVICLSCCKAYIEVCLNSIKGINIITQLSSLLLKPLLTIFSPSFFFFYLSTKLNLIKLVSEPYINGDSLKSLMNYRPCAYNKTKSSGTKIDQPPKKKSIHLRQGNHCTASIQPPQFQL